MPGTTTSLKRIFSDDFHCFHLFAAPDRALHLRPEVLLCCVRYENRLAVTGSCSSKHLWIRSCKVMGGRKVAGKDPRETVSDSICFLTFHTGCYQEGERLPESAQREPLCPLQVSRPCGLRQQTSASSHLGRGGGGIVTKSYLSCDLMDSPPAPAWMIALYLGCMKKTLMTGKR